MVSAPFFTGVSAAAAAVVVLLAAVGTPSYGQQELVSDQCLACLCEMATQCNETDTNCDGDVCGVFQITRPYWTDAGKPVLPGDSPSDPQAFSRCLKDAYCSGLTVKAYMAKFAKDCNGDGKIACDDFAYIHMLGGYGCNARLPQVFYNRFYSCQRQLNA